MKFSIRLLYLYLFSFIGLLIAVIGCVRIIQLGIKVYVFKGADQFNAITPPAGTPDGKTVVLTQAEKDEQKKANDLENQRQRQREVSEAVAMLVVGIPLYKYHWRIIQKESRKTSY
ncbi:hypothetical protein A2210_02770 [Candidatus Woesebacteria bacterium RIFOXYA1_FULL_40_18]|uniref:DUF5671 domain-containing protein n=4 Tax=Candidatus Woeseibacteriota TaxID=1752722 RepID=A0A0G0SDY5_9BACT|nr:MAG: hypothetical protein UT72_C0029G0004 [Candidatus Woesebacteria bacterium GW2011_GWB1_40_101]KKR63103.1 MAG: hypothetical protein UU03_C0012G0005 [Candidatus Woesebacteria bacterium GW2011_GWA1_40_45]OGM76554.1 MAG: hypothetical protein A2210_02770 [Candidatus Woesebacteria bacterium RIFOXYA1_FULL_40_18]OGM86933.1 MAG: hypothetical protein A2614_01155 [Candidatus Woesebacteria bacterium RIFOXYD1_FULL_40_21]